MESGVKEKSKLYRWLKVESGKWKVESGIKEKSKLYRWLKVESGKWKVELRKNTSPLRQKQGKI